MSLTLKALRRFLALVELLSKQSNGLSKILMLSLECLLSLLEQAFMLQSMAPRSLLQFTSKLKATY